MVARRYRHRIAASLQLLQLAINSPPDSHTLSPTDKRNWGCGSTFPPRQALIRPRQALIRASLESPRGHGPLETFITSVTGPFNCRAGITGPVRLLQLWLIRALPSINHGQLQNCQMFNVFPSTPVLQSQQYYRAPVSLKYAPLDLLSRPR